MEVASEHRWSQGQVSLYNIVLTVLQSPAELQSVDMLEERNAVTHNTLTKHDRKGFSDYDTIEDTFLPPALKPRGLADYSSIEDIMSALPSEAKEGNFNVFIVTNEAARDPNTSEEVKNVNEDTTTTTTPKNKVIPVYSVVNKKRHRNNSDGDPEFSLGNGVSQDTQAKGLVTVDSAPPPIPLRTYEMGELHSIKPDSGKHSTIQKSKSEVALIGNIQSTEFNTDVATFAFPSSSKPRRNSYESVDLVFQE
jgi:hypothetical protein